MKAIASLFKRKAERAHLGLLNDRSIWFDSRPQSLRIIEGEEVILEDAIVVDGKGPAADSGCLLLTTLRLLWLPERSSRSSISIGLSCVVSHSVSTTGSAVNGVVKVCLDQS